MALLPLDVRDAAHYAEIKRKAAILRAHPRFQALQVLEMRPRSSESEIHIVVQLELLDGTSDDELARAYEEA